MTSETKTLIEFSDLAGLHISCLHCGAQFIRPIGNTRHFPSECQSCNEKWFGDSATQVLDSITNLSFRLRDFQTLVNDLKQKQMKVAIKIEMATLPKPLTSQT